MNNLNFRICFFPGALMLGGIGKLTVNLARQLICYGYEVDFYLTKCEGDYLSQIPKEVFLKKGKGSAIKSIISFAKYLKKRKPNVIISARDYLNFICIIITRIISPKTKVIASVHVDYSGIPKFKRTIRAKMMNYLLKRVYCWADNIVAVSNGVAKDFSIRFNYPLHKINVIYNPTYQKENYEIEKEILFSSFFDTKKPIIIGVGRLTEQKNFSLLIKSFKKVNDTLEAKLIILGEGHLRDELETLIEDLGLKLNVLLPGYVENPIDYIKRSDVFVLSSSYEGFGNVIVEAMGTGISIISTDCPSGPCEILDYGRFGRLVPLDNERDMSNAIIEIIRNPIDKGIVIKRAELFSVENITKQYIDLFI